jgi:hypothetical protein
MSKREVILLSVLGVLLVLVGYAYFLMWPQFQQLQNTLAANLSLSSQIETLKAEQEVEEEDTVDMEALGLELENLRQVIPLNYKQPAVYVDALDAADQVGITLVGVEFSPPTSELFIDGESVADTETTTDGSEGVVETEDVGVEVDPDDVDAGSSSSNYSESADSSGSSSSSSSSGSSDGVSNPTTGEEVDPYSPNGKILVICPMVISFSGDYPDIKDYLYVLQSKTRMYTIQAITFEEVTEETTIETTEIQENEDGTTTEVVSTETLESKDLIAEIIIYAYAYVDEDDELKTEKVEYDFLSGSYGRTDPFQ